MTCSRPFPPASLARVLASALALSTCGPAGSAGAARQATPDTLAWPAAEWTRSTPEAEGLDAAPLRALDEGIRAGRFGWVDRLVVVRHGRLVLSERYANDYVELSRGRSGPLGCGTDACANPDDVHDYNYLHPDVHPFYRGRDVHSLQSVTKSVTATLVGIALGRGEIESVETPFLT
ncbi:MAG TPA: hypothetical protein VK849_14810, partial [Longimicrobiales bacterium]|nr:hypothetical protein [Longimicrobiales bacterium]